MRIDGMTVPVANFVGSVKNSSSSALVQTPCCDLSPGEYRNASEAIGRSFRFLVLAIGRWAPHRPTYLFVSSQRHEGNAGQIKNCTQLQRRDGGASEGMTPSQFRRQSPEGCSSAPGALVGWFALTGRGIRRLLRRDLAYDRLKLRVIFCQRVDLLYEGARSRGASPAVMAFPQSCLAGVSLAATAIGPLPHTYPGQIILDF